MSWGYIEKCLDLADDSFWKGSKSIHIFRVTTYIENISFPSLVSPTVMIARIRTISSKEHRIMQYNKFYIT